MKKPALIYPLVSLKDDYYIGKRYEEVMPRVSVDIIGERILGRKFFLEKLKESRYKGQDMLSNDEFFADRARHSCGASVEDILAAKAVMENYFAARMERLAPGK